MTPVTAYVTVGVPASGKTQAISALFHGRSDVSVFCADDIRAELTGSDADQTENAEVWSKLRERVQERLQAGGSAVIDATNTIRDHRVELIEFCRIHGAERVEAIWLRTPLAVCLDRNGQRSRTVPPDIVKKMDNRLIREPPRTFEGFDEVHCVP